MTNSPEGFLEFYEKCQGRLVTKTVCALRTWRDGEEYTAFTHTVRRRDAAKYRAIRYAPIIVQEYVPKRLELRITVVGSSVFAAAIHSQTSPLTRNDWRRECDPDRCYSYYARYVLPAHVEELCVRLVETLGLCYGAIDMVLTPDDEYIFLEINPNGQWAFIQQATGLPIGEAIADLLVRGAVFPTREGSMPAPFDAALVDAFVPSRAAAGSGARGRRGRHRASRAFVKPTPVFARTCLLIGPPGRRGLTMTFCLAYADGSTRLPSPGGGTMECPGPLSMQTIGPQTPWSPSTAGIRAFRRR